MTFVEKLRLFQDREHFEKLVNEKYEKIMNKNKIMIGLFIAWTFFNFIIGLLFPLTNFNIISCMLSSMVLLIMIMIFDGLYDKYLDKISLIVKEKGHGYRFFKYILNEKFLAYFFISLFAISFISFFLFSLRLLKNEVNELNIYFLFITHFIFLFVSLFLLLLNFFVSKSIHCHFIDEKINDLIKEEKIKIYNEHFDDFDLKYKTNDKIKFINQVVKKLSDELSNDNLSKELTLLDRFKESNLEFDLNEATELNNIVLSVSLLNEFNSKKESLSNGLIYKNGINLNKRFDRLLEEYQSFIDVNQKYLHEGESNTLSFKIKFDKLIETEKSITERLKDTVDLPNDNETWFIHIEDEINSLNNEKENVIEELKLKKEQSEQYVKDILVKEVS